MLRVTKARVLRRDKDRTKTQEDRNVELTPRALQVLKAHRELRAAYVAAGKISHDRLFFLEDGSAVSDPEVTRWRWNESLQKLGIRQRGPYHARHSSVTWALMLGKNLLWAAKRHGHSVEVMLRMYAAWIEGAMEDDIQTIRNAMEGRLKVHLLPFAPASSQDNARQIVLRPLESPNSASSSASSPEGQKVSLEKARKKVAERVGFEHFRRPMRISNLLILWDPLESTCRHASLSIL